MTDPASNVTSYTYDTENNLLSITDANLHTTNFAYDSFGRVTKITFPSGYIETYAYDADNNLTSKTDRNGKTIQYVYDALSRLTQKTYPDSTSAEYAYDLVGKILAGGRPFRCPGSVIGELTPSGQLTVKGHRRFRVFGCRTLCAVGKGCAGSRAMSEHRGSKNPRMSILGFLSDFIPRTWEQVGNKTCQISPVFAIRAKAEGQTNKGIQQIPPRMLVASSFGMTTVAGAKGTGGMPSAGVAKK